MLLGPVGTAQVGTVKCVYYLPVCIYIYVMTGRLDGERTCPSLGLTPCVFIDCITC